MFLLFFYSRLELMEIMNLNGHKYFSIKNGKISKSFVFLRENKTVYLVFFRIGERKN